jgi:hypothetical protein
MHATVTDACRKERAFISEGPGVHKAAFAIGYFLLSGPAKPADTFAPGAGRFAGAHSRPRSAKDSASESPTTK